MQQFFDVMKESLSSVLSQCSGVPWRVAIAERSDEKQEIEVALTASGNLRGMFSFRFAPQAGACLAQALLMTPEPAAEFGAEEREAVEELLRQVCGVAANALRPRFPEIGFQVAAASPAWAPATGVRCELAREGVETAVELWLSAEFASALQSRTVETDRPALRQALSTRNLDLLMDVRLGVRLRFGRRRMRLREILELHPGTVVELDRQVQEPVELLVDTKLIAKGDVVVVDGNYGLRITDIVTPCERVESIQ